uniref:HAD family hydrolase n=1 Tax=Rubrimonas sp. TaxID=2036015 RepID=UPI002FDE1E25
MKRVDFPDLGALDVGSGGLVARDACLGWRVGEDGVRAIAALADDSVAFIAFGSRTLAVVAPGAGPVAIYPVPPLCRGRLTAVCLDLDGTLIDSEPLWIAVIERTIGEVTGIAGFRFAEGERRYVSGRSVGAHLAWALSAHAPGIGLDAARAVHARFTREALAQLASGGLAGDAPRLLPGFEALMATIRAHGLPVALVTSGVEAKMWPTLIAALGAAGLGAPSEQFDAILCGGASAADAPIGSLSDLPMKPHPWLYAEALSIGLG